MPDFSALLGNLAQLPPKAGRSFYEALAHGGDITGAMPGAYAQEQPEQPGLYAQLMARSPLDNRAPVSSDRMPPEPVTLFNTKTGLKITDQDIDQAMHIGMAASGGGLSVKGAQSSENLFSSLFGASGGISRFAAPAKDMDSILSRLPEMKLSSLLKEGDQARSPFLTKEGRVLATEGDHSSVAGAAERADNGLIRMVYGPSSFEPGRNTLNLEFVHGQTVTPKQKQMIDRLSHKSNVYIDYVDREGNRLVNHPNKLPEAE